MTSVLAIEVKTQGFPLAPTSTTDDVTAFGISNVYYPTAEAIWMKMEWNRAGYSDFESDAL
jgi:hypothetical protein